MNIQTINIFNPSSTSKIKIFNIWGMSVIALVFYSFLVWEAAYKIMPFSHDTPTIIEKVENIEALSNSGVPYSEVAEEAMEAYPLWNNLTTMVTGTYFGFGSNGNSEQVKYYTSMKPIEKSSLSIHMILGGLLLVLGVFQFSPRFRKKHRKAHRMVGGVYIISTFIMSFAAVYHLVHTGIENTYQGFAFNIQLWFLSVSTIISQIIAIYQIKKRNIALHLGFQLYTFAAFLNAPVQRYDWATLGSIYSHLTQGEVNNLVNILTFWQCLMIGCIMFAWNRASSPLKKQAVAVKPQPIALKVFLSIAGVVAVWSILTTYLGEAGLGTWKAAQVVAPATTLAADAQLYADKTLQTSLFGLLMSLTVVSGLWLMLKDEGSKLARNAFYTAASLCGLQQISWGIQLGEPSMAVTAGGGFYIVSGLSLLFFTLLALYQQLKGRENKWHESMMIFAVNFAFTPALAIWGHALWYALDVIPEYYINRGHGYVLAVGGAILMPSFNGFIAMMTSRETQSRAIN